MTKKKKVTELTEKQKNFLTVYENKLGNISAVCRSIHISRECYYKWLKKNPEFKRQVKEIEEGSIDWAENKLKQLMSGVVLPETKVFCNARGKITKVDMEKHYVPDNTSIIFFLKTKGKKRGYIESQKIEAEVKGELTLFDLFNKKKNKDDSED